MFALFVKSDNTDTGFNQTAKSAVNIVIQARSEEH